jgi:hypothetical protein
MARNSFQMTHVQKSRGIFCLLVLFVFVKVHAGELYRWVDKDGNSIVSDTPPPEGVQIKGKDVYDQDAPAAVNAAKEERKRNAREYDSQVYKRKSAERDHRSIQREIKSAKDDLARAEETYKRYKKEYRNARTQRSTDYWKDMLNDQEREVEQKRQRLADLENER